MVYLLGVPVRKTLFMTTGFVILQPPATQMHTMGCPVAIRKQMAVNVIIEKVVNMLSLIFPLVPSEAK